MLDFSIALKLLFSMKTAAGTSPPALQTTTTTNDNSNNNGSGSGGGGGGSPPIRELGGGIFEESVPVACAFCFVLCVCVCGRAFPDELRVSSHFPDRFQHYI